MMNVSKHLIFAGFFFMVLFPSFELKSCTGSSSTVIGDCPEIEKRSLLNFKQSLQDPENKLSSWNHDEVNCCKWKGVFCNNLTGHVHQLRLPKSFISGKLSPSLLNLKHLKYLDLSQNQFDETIPSFIGSFKSLEYLNLSFAEIQGKIPHAIGNLSNLRTLCLESVYFLKVDSLEWLSRLSKLEYLNMNGLDLSKASNWAQQVINKLPSLVELHLSSCSLNNKVPLTSSDVNNITTSKLAKLDLSGNMNFQNIHVPRWIFHLSNLIQLDLSDNHYEGPIPSVSNTTKLKHIDLSYNHFSNSSIQKFLSFLNDVEYLDLGLNHLQDILYDSIANLTSLSTLVLYGNDISGKIPRGITDLCKLQKLDLGGNKLHGGVSDLFGNVSACFLESLESLDLSGNQLSGPLTHQFGEFKSLRILYLSSNSLSGVIPSNLGNLSSLENLYLQDNKFTGNLPESIGQISNLQTLHIEKNMMEGVVTETHFSHLSRLEHLFAFGNNLTLKVDQNWIPPFKLLSLRLGSWNLGSPIPPWLDTQKTSIEWLDLSNTGLYGIVPNWLWRIKILNLSYNQLRGKISNITDPICDPTRVDQYYGMHGQYVYLGSNKFSGQLPRVGKWLVELDLSNNFFSGDLSHFFCNISTSFRLRNLDLGGNQLTGELPNCFIHWPSLDLLNLGNNHLSGRIPNSIGLLVGLRSMNLNRNNFSGDIPLSMRNCWGLAKMDLSHNNLSGKLPKSILKSLTGLTILILRSNKLSCQITSAICQLSSLQILDLSDNMFSGMIPSCVDGFTSMATIGGLYVSFRSLFSDVYLEYASIATKGKELTYPENILYMVTSIDLSKNNLSGHIPKEITSLVELITLNLSRNHLTGMIPSSIGNMKQLESLDFSINSLSGDLPNSFTVMSSLNYLNVSYNNLTGRIPESTQLQSFTESSFIGNNLSGPPVTSSCNTNDGKAAQTIQSKNEESDKPEIEWLYVFISLGYAVGLSAFLTAIFLKKSWREAYYEFLENIYDNVYVYVLVKWRRLTSYKNIIRSNYVSGRSGSVLA